MSKSNDNWTCACSTSYSSRQKHAARCDYLLAELFRAVGFQGKALQNVKSVVGGQSTLTLAKPKSRLSQ